MLFMKCRVAGVMLSPKQTLALLVVYIFYRLLSPPRDSSVYRRGVYPLTSFYPGRSRCCKYTGTKCRVLVVTRLAKCDTCIGGGGGYWGRATRYIHIFSPFCREATQRVQNHVRFVVALRVRALLPALF